MSAPSPTALSTVLRRISNEPRAPSSAAEAPFFGGSGPKLYGFDEPAATGSKLAPEPAAEDIVALLAEQPEVARLVDAEEGPAAVPTPGPERARRPAEQRFALLPEEPPRDPEIVIAPLSGQSGRVAPLRAPQDVPQQAPKPPSPDGSIEPPHEPGPPMDRLGRQPLSRNRRLYRRVRLSAEIEIDGVPSSLIDVSIGGFAATGVADLAANKLVPVLLRMNIDGVEVATRLNARIVYAYRDRLSGRFIDLTSSQTAFLRYIVTWRGESVGMVGTTTLLDAIIGSADQGHAKLSNGSRERWWAGLLGWKVNPPR